MTCRKAQRFMPNIKGSFLTLTLSVVFLTTGLTFGQYQQSTQLRWKPLDANGQPLQQATVVTSAQQYPAPQSPIRQVQHLEPAQAPTLAPPMPQDQSVPPEYRIAQLPGSGQATYDTAHPERSRSGAVGQTPNQPLSTPAPTPSRPFAERTPSTDFSDDLSSTSPNTRSGINDPCIDPRDPKLFKPMSELSIQLDFDLDLNSMNMCPINYGTFDPRNWQCTCFNYVAPNTCRKADYFSDTQVERYGHSWGPFLQPVISGGKFYLSVLFLPYKMGVTPPQECVYDIGYFRPGSCAPYMIDPLPISVRGALMQAGATVGLAYAIP